MGVFGVEIRVSIDDYKSFISVLIIEQVNDS